MEKLTLQEALTEQYNDRVRQMAASKTSIALLANEQPDKVIGSRPVKGLGSQNTHVAITVSQLLDQEQDNHQAIEAGLKVIEDLLEKWGQ
jgi:hypothetical protein